MGRCPNSPDDAAHYVVAMGRKTPIANSGFVRISVVGHQLHYSKIEVCFGAQVKHIQLAPENIFLS